MKKKFTIFAAFWMAMIVFIPQQAMAQAPEELSYQAIIRDASNNPVMMSTVGMQISILQGSSSGTAVYVETQTPMTNANGLISIQIGTGMVVSGTFSTIDWGNGPYFIKSETDPAGGTAYTITGTNQVLSVPYALHANEAKSLTGASVSTTGDTLYLGTNSWVIIPGISVANLPVGTITALICDSAIHMGTITAGYAAVGVSSNVPYSGGNGATHSGQTVNSTGVTGLTATASAGLFANGRGYMMYAISGMPSGSGTASFALSIGGQMCTLEVTVVPDPYPSGTVFCASGPTAVMDVTNPATGKTWMDRNMGATQVATSSTDMTSYGDLFQWGRAADGHQCRDSDTLNVLSASDQPGHAFFILTGGAPNNWRSPENASLWQGVSGTNNPCPSGYRLPTDAELDNERMSWSSNAAAGAFGSPLKLTAADRRGFGS